MLLKKYHYKAESLEQEFATILKMTNETNYHIEVNELLNEDKDEVDFEDEDEDE